MKLAKLILLLVLPFITTAQPAATPAVNYSAPEKVRAAFKAMLQQPAVAFRPSLQTTQSDSFTIERGFIYSEATEKVPLVLYKPLGAPNKRFPVVICLHGTGGSKDDEGIKDILRQLCRNGIIGVAIDARYHGERVEGGANKSEQYVDAIATAWKNKDTAVQQHPFYYDTVYDLWRLTDYLVSRDDIAPGRIGMMGISMGGIETWLAASVDTRIKVTVPVIAAQSFAWSLNHNNWQGRARTIWKAHEEAAKDLGDTSVTAASVTQVWAKLLPGITEDFDCPSMLRLFAPRPLLLLNNEKDQNCPLPGALLAFKTAKEAYHAKHADTHLQVHVTPNEPHRFLPEHEEMTVAWFKKWL